MSDTPTPSPASVIRVLFVDDDPDFLELIEVFLDERTDDLTVLTATAGDSALERLRGGGIDCVVSDYRMPGMDGLDLLGVIREEFPELPFILFTGKGGEEIAAEAVSVGVTDYIRKSSDPKQFGLLANRIRNVVERHRVRVQYEAVFEAVSEAILVIDADRSTITDANRRAGELWGYSHERLIGSTVSDLRADEAPATNSTTDADSLGPASADTVPGGKDPAAFRGSNESVWQCRAADGSFFWGAVSQRQAEIDGRLQELVIVRDVTRQTVRESQLDGLLDAVRDLLKAGTEEAVAETVTRAATEVLRFDSATVYLLDLDGQRFRRPGESIDNQSTTPLTDVDRLWDAIDSGELVGHPERRSGTTDHLDDEDDNGDGPPSSSPDSANPLFVPLGEFGVLECFPGPASDGHDIDLLELLATFTTGALDRTRRETLLRDREELVRQNRDELLALNHVNEVIRDINQALVSVSSREGIERLVCEKFAATDRYSFAWMGTLDGGDRSITPTARAGRGEGYLPECIELDRSGPSALVQAVTDRTVSVIDRLTPESMGPDRYQLARERGYRSVAFVPIVHQQVLYRLLAIYADIPQAFGSRERDVLGELGETIGLAMAAAEWRSAQIAETAVELELSIKSDDPVFELTKSTACTVDFTGLEETDEGHVRVFAILRGTTYMAFETAVSSIPTLTGARRLGETDGGIRAVFSIRAGPLRNAITSGGVSMQTAHLEAGTGRFELTVPTWSDVRWVVEQFEAAFDAVELVSRRNRYRSQQPPGRAPLESLTDRQREVLLAAYHAGYFDRPRSATGETVASLLGVTQPTFNEHLRNAEHRLFDQLLGTEPDGESIPS